MILIISESSDSSTDEVTKHLISMNQKFMRINEDDKITEISLEINNDSENLDFEIYFSSGKQLIFSEIKSVWYRRGDLYFDYESLNNPSKFDLLQAEYLYTELDFLKNFFLKQLSSLKSLGNYFKWQPNKLELLLAARKNGLLIPNTLVTNNISKIQALHNEKKLITKGIQEALDIENTEYAYFGLTSRVNQELIDASKNLFYSKVQEEINKEYEIRVFYLNGEFYSMAIFSQSNDKTEVDFRNYDVQQPNRNVPYNLPKNIETKINSLMIQLELNTASIDLIKGKNGKYYFLEVNPIGQYSMVSEACNYNLDKKIAEFLSYEN